MTTSDAAVGADENGSAVALIVGDSPLRVWALTPGERLRRSLRKAGDFDIRQWPTQVAPGRDHLVLRSDYVFDPVLIKELARAPQTVLMDRRSERPVAARIRAEEPDIRRVVGALAADAPLPSDLARSLTVAGPDGLGSIYSRSLRKREIPYLMRLNAAELPAIERRVFAGSYKGVTDVVTKCVWPKPAFHVTRWCAEMGITPNMVTWISLGLVIVAAGAFLQGWFVAGLAAAWGMTFLDTVDGKLARVTLTDTKLGDIFDHGIDLIHPPFWYWAWAVGLETAGTSLPWSGILLLVIISGYVLQRALEGFFILLFGVEIHVWRRFDSRFRLIAARRNPNLILLSVSVVAGRPDLGLAAVAAWTAISLAVHAVQTVQAAIARRQAPLVSWLSR